MQHCTKVPLLLNNIRRYTSDDDECNQLTESLEKLETSLSRFHSLCGNTRLPPIPSLMLNDKFVQKIWKLRCDGWRTLSVSRKFSSRSYGNPSQSWSREHSFQRYKHFCIIHPDLYILTQDWLHTFQFLKSTLNKQPCERLLASPKRQLLHEGAVTLLGEFLQSWLLWASDPYDLIPFPEISKTIDMYMFLFDDILLLTRIKKPPRKVGPLDLWLSKSSISLKHNFAHQQLSKHKAFVNISRALAFTTMFPWMHCIIIMLLSLLHLPETISCWSFGWDFNSIRTDRWSCFCCIPSTNGFRSTHCARHSAPRCHR